MSNRLVWGLLLAFCTLSALPGLAFGWRTAPLERYTPLTFTLWLVPVLLQARRSLGLDPSALLLAGGIGVLGVVLDLHLVRFVALALALNSLFAQAPRPLRFAHLATSLLWMPVFGWLFQGLSPTLLAGLRSLGVLWLLIPFRKGRTLL